MDKRLESFARIVETDQGPVVVTKDPNKENQDACDLLVSAWATDLGRLDMRLGPLTYEEVDKVIADQPASNAVARKLVDRVMEILDGKAPQGGGQ